MQSSAGALLGIIAGAETTGFLEMRPLGARQEFFDLSEEGWAVHMGQRIREVGRTRTVYVGAAPRTRPEGVKGAVDRAWALWVDCDDEAAVKRLLKFKPEPTMIVDSGSPGHAHAWWSLRRPIRSSHLRWANLRLAFAIGADPAVTDVARVMRPPGSMNFKSSPPRPATVFHDSGVQYELPRVIGGLEDPPMPEPKPAPSTPRRSDFGPDHLVGISSREFIPRLTGRAINSRGKVQCPFHGGGQERTPSLMAYADPSRGFHCFGCGATGSIYNFAGLLWGLQTTGDDFRELRERLLQEMG